MIPLIGSPPPAAEAKFRAALRLVGEALIEWSTAMPAPKAVEPSPPPTPAPAAVRPMARPISEMLVWTADHDRMVRELAGTAPAQRVADQLGVSLSTLYKHCSRLQVSLAVGRKKGHRVQPKAPPSPEPAPGSVPAVVVFTEANFAKLRRLAGTMPRAAVIAEMGLSRTSVEKLARHLELSLRPVKVAPADTAAATEKRETFIIPDGHQAERDTDVRPTGVTVVAEAPVEDSLPRAEPQPSEVVPEPQASAPIEAERAAPEILVPAAEAPVPEVAAEPEAVVRADVPAVQASPGIELQEVVSLPIEAPQVPVGPSVPAIPRGDRSAPNKRAPAIAPTKASWIRLRHPDGRWLRMDCLGWVKDKKDSYHAPAKLLDNVRAKFPLAAECRVVPEPAWTPRDIEFSRVTR